MRLAQVGRRGYFSRCPNLNANVEIIECKAVKFFDNVAVNQLQFFPMLNRGIEMRSL